MGSADAGNGPERGRDDEPGEERYADLPPVKVTVPDDARDLDADVRAYYRELKRRQAGPPPPPPPPPGSSFANARPGRLLLGVFALLLIVASLAMMISPRREGPPAKVPLATSSGADARGLGEGLLMPDIRIRVGAIEQPLLDLRPAVFALVPPECRCEGELETIVSEARIQNQLKVYLVANFRYGVPPPEGELGPDPTGAARTELLRLARGLHVSVLDDPSGQIVNRFSQGALTLVLMSPDGLVAEVTRVTSGPALELKLAEISRSDIVEMQSAGPS